MSEQSHEPITNARLATLELVRTGRAKPIREGGRILDIGCGHLEDSRFRIWAGVKASSYLGIDTKSKDDDSWPLSGNPYDRYLQSRERFPFLPDLDSDQFNAAFDFKHGPQADAFDFLPTMQQSFDLVLLANVLHFPLVKAKWRSLLALSWDTVAPNGMLFVEVITAQATFTLAEDQRPFSLGEISELEQACPAGRSFPDLIREGRTVVTFRKES